jgi:hypothetical protein
LPIPAGRQTIVEHPFGTIKRQWGFSYILTKKGIERASAGVGFMFIAYNFRRIVNITGINRLREYLKVLASMFFDIFNVFCLKISLIKASFSGVIILEDKFRHTLKPS